MPHITFIYPCVGRFPETKYVRSWQMEPLAIGVLSALTPGHWEQTFFDDRQEEIDYDQPTDIVAISVETYSARRAYQIADAYRAKGVTVVMGGYHPTLVTEDCLPHVDAVCVGMAEDVFPSLLGDFEKGQLKPLYRRDPAAPMIPTTPNRDLFADKRYLPLTLIETSRGCPFDCQFCSITAFFKKSWHRRPIDDIVNEIQTVGRKFIFFVDDNILGDAEDCFKLFEALKPLKIQWVSQASINITHNEKLMKALADSGCLGLLIGFESLNKNNLEQMNKTVNQSQDYDQAMAVLHRYGIAVYGTFVFGYGQDEPADFEATIDFAKRHKLFCCAFNHMVPFPGTPFYEQCARQGSLLKEKWWLDENYRFGQVVFAPETLAAKELEEQCMNARREFYSWGSILKRTTAWRANFRNPTRAGTYLVTNYLLREELNRKFTLPLGLQDARK
jgi:radical SAM superfamily enzyme YgiQ (UPF0313 family)